MGREDRADRSAGSPSVARSPSRRTAGVAAIARTSPNPADPTTSLACSTSERASSASCRRSRPAPGSSPSPSRPTASASSPPRSTGPCASGTQPPASIPQTFTGQSSGVNLAVAPDGRTARDRRAERQRGGVGPLRGRSSCPGRSMELAGQGCLTTPASSSTRRARSWPASQADGTVALIDLRDPRADRHAARPQRDAGDALAFFPDGRRLATGGANGRGHALGRGLEPW